MACFTQNIYSFFKVIFISFFKVSAKKLFVLQIILRFNIFYETLCNKSYFALKFTQNHAVKYKMDP